MWKIADKILIVLLGIFIINSSQVNYKVKAEDNLTRAIAHRGLVGEAPENTVSSILDASKEHVDFAELDVQETKDGVVVLMHDRSLKRVTGINKKVSDLNYSQIEKLHFIGGSASDGRAERIPKLDTVMKRANGKIKLDIEIKPYGRKMDLTAKVVGLIEKNKIVKKCIVTSFDYDVLAYIKQLNPEIKTSFLLKSAVRDVSIKNVDIFSVEQHFVTAQLVKNIHRHNRKIHVWTVNNVEDMRRFEGYGVDYIITDNLDGFNSIYDENSEVEQGIFTGIEKIIKIV